MNYTKHKFSLIVLFAFSFFLLTSVMASIFTCHIYIFLPLILGIIRVVLSWCSTFFSIHFWIVCVFFSFFKYENIWKKQQPDVLSKKSVLKNFAKLTGKYLCQSRPETLLRKSLQHRYFPVIFTKNFRIPFL